MNLIHAELFGVLIVTTYNLAYTLSWNNNPVATYRPGYNYGDGERYTNVRQWDINQGGKPWQMNVDSYQTGWNYPSGNVKGYNGRRCFDIKHCNQGECCQFTGFSNSGSCVYAGYSNTYACNQYRPRDPTWIQRPINPGNDKGGRVTMTRYVHPGACPPQNFQQGARQYCRQDEDCTYSQKCCFVQGKSVCLHPIFV